jgi:hypothetical protein
MKGSFVKVGEIGVDAGLCWVGDPGYIFHQGKLPSTLGEDWTGFCSLLDGGATQFNYELGHPGLGVVVSTGYGDGTYPVYVEKDSHGVIIKLMIDFDPEEEGDD